MPQIGSWPPGFPAPEFDRHSLGPLLERVREPLHLVRRSGAIGASLTPPVAGDDAEWHGTLPPLYPEWLGDRDFLNTHGVRFPYIAGEMATGIATSRMVIAAARSGMLGFFGSAGLPLEQTEQAITEIEA